MRVLVTGGAGFLGSHLCDLLIARGDTVVCLDDLSTGNRANIEHLRISTRFRFVEASTNRASLAWANASAFSVPSEPVRSVNIGRARYAGGDAGLAR